MAASTFPKNMPAALAAHVQPELREGNLHARIAATASISFGQRRWHARPCIVTQSRETHWQRDVAQNMLSDLE